MRGFDNDDDDNNDDVFSCIILLQFQIFIKNRWQEIQKKRKEDRNKVPHTSASAWDEYSLWTAYTWSLLRQSALSRWNRFLFHTLSLSSPSGTYVASHKLFVTEATQRQKRLHSLHLLWDGQCLIHTIWDKAMPCIPRGTSFLFLPEPRLLSSSSSVLKTSFKSNFFFCFPGGGGGAVAAAFGVLGCCCTGEFQIFATASTHTTYFYSIWRRATPQIHTLQIYEDR